MTNKQIEKDMMYLIYCSLHGLAPETSRVAEMDLEQVYLAAKRHSLEAVTYMALEKMGQMDNIASGEWLSEWKEKRLKAFRKNLMLDAERNKLFAFMDKNDIWYMPLKGSVLKELYPKQEMRQMSDNDILFDPAFQSAVHDYFVEHGYKATSYEECNRDVYEKAPIYNYEMHTSFFKEGCYPVWEEYYRNVKDRLIKNETGAGYHFSDEDFYVYFITHAFKHYDAYGTGIRSFVDCYVYQTSKKLDWNYIENELRKLEIADFEKEFRRTSFLLFDSVDGIDRLSDEEYVSVRDCMDAGTYGTTEAFVKTNLRKLQKNKQTITGKTKGKYYLERLIPSKEYFLKFHPVIYKLKFPIPFFLIYRLFRGMILHGRKFFKEAVMVWKMDKKEEDRK